MNQLKYLLLFFSLLASLIAYSQQPFQIGEAYEVESTVLEEKRSYWVYLPPSYHFSGQQSYPVLYLIDGAYNFHFCTGMVEQMSITSSVIPEMIIVGIDDRGQQNYINNLTLPPADAQDPAIGKAEQFMDFIGKELKPQIEKQFRTAGYDLLYGHSIGGLFTVTTLLYQPELFDSYIAVSPSMWWNEYSLSKEAAKKLEKGTSVPRMLYLTLGNEQQMGVHELVGVLDQVEASGLKWQFSPMPEESHGSVGLTSLNWALRDLFKGWELERERFLALGNAKAVSAHFQQMAQSLGYAMPFPPEMLKQMVGYFLRQGQTEQLEILEQEVAQHFPQSSERLALCIAQAHYRNQNYEQSLALYQEQAQRYPKSFDVLHGLGQNYEAMEKWKEAVDHYQRALGLAEAQGARPWMQNYLRADLERVLKRSDP